MIMIHFNDYLFDKLSDSEEARTFAEVAAEEFLTDGDLKAFLLSMHFLIEKYKKPLDRNW